MRHPNGATQQSFNLSHRESRINGVKLTHQHATVNDINQGEMQSKASCELKVEPQKMAVFNKKKWSERQKENEKENLLLLATFQQLGIVIYPDHFCSYFGPTILTESVFWLDYRLEQTESQVFTAKGKINEIMNLGGNHHGC